MKHTHTKIIGKGGIDCPCCRKGQTVKEKRVALNRIHRHKENTELKNLTELAIRDEWDAEGIKYFEKNEEVSKRDSDNNEGII